MKKSISIIFSLALLLLITGCGKNQVVCTANVTENGVAMAAKIVADFDENDKLSDATITYDLGNTETANQYCSLFKLIEDQAKGITIECSGTKVTIKGYAKLQEEDEEVDEDDETIDEDDSESLIGISKEEFIRQMEASEESKFTCR